MSDTGHGLVEVQGSNEDRGIVARVALPAGTRILLFERTFIPHPTRHTLRVSQDLHQLSIDPDLPENFVNHSCAPNAFIDWDELSLVAGTDIAPGQAITYDYMTSDWDGEDPFLCGCGAPHCRKTLQGARHLSPQEQRRIKAAASPFIREQIIKGLGLDPVPAAAQIAAAPSRAVAPQETTARVAWCTDTALAAPLAAFFVAQTRPEYISHSELQGPRAASPGRWSEAIEAIVRGEIEEYLTSTPTTAGSTRVAVATLDGALVGMALVLTDLSAATPFAVIEDMIVAAATRGLGIGTEMMAWIAAQAQAAGARRLFLESGIENHAAHHFFERNGFHTCSIVMMRQLPAAG